MLHGNPPGVTLRSDSYQAFDFPASDTGKTIATEIKLINMAFQLSVDFQCPMPTEF
jgi:hypothetical protein